MILMNLLRLHYTTTSGFLGMFKDYTEDQPNVKLRATHYKYMNDPNEYEFGTKFCTEIIDQIENELKVPNEYRVKTLVDSELYHDALADYRMTAEGQTICPYLISFSKAYDSLHMWDMYASNGNGLALVFNYQKLLEAKILLKDCFYCNPNCSNVIQCLTSKFKEEINKIYLEQDKGIPISVVKESMEQGNNVPYYNRVYILHTLICGHIGIRIKNWCYNAENEARITINGNKSELLFRERTGVLLPYIEYPIPFDCVENIIVGPTADFNRVRESILIFLDYKGVRTWDKSRILQSNVPYRL